MSSNDLLVSVITTKRACDLPEADGWTIRRQGSVTSAAPPAAPLRARSTFTLP